MSGTMSGMSSVANRYGISRVGRVSLVALLAWFPVAFGAVWDATADEAAERGQVVFKTHLRELLAHRCAGCHGAGGIESGFELSTRESLLAGGDSGPVLSPTGADGRFRATESRLYKLAARLEEPHMPEEGDALTAQQLEWLAEWIEAGAPYDRPLVDHSQKGPWTERTVPPEARDYWAFLPLADVAIPDPVDGGGWCRNPIDRFILAGLQRAGLAPSPPATPHVLRRRLSFDLTGLPPTADECEVFAEDPSDTRLERVVDELLARPAFGERWAQHWLDVARFAESFGYEQDYDRPHAFHYRDFVIRAFNDDLPFDTFLRWQLAGDELAPGNPDAMAATGFLAAGAFPTQLTEREFESARASELDDMVGTIGTAMLGVTIGCARCHDHKFDPVPQADYYRLASTFTTTLRSNVDIQKDPDGHAKAMAMWRERLDEAIARRSAHDTILASRHESWLQEQAHVITSSPPSAAESVWHTGTLVSIRSQSGGAFTTLADGSLLASGEPADRDTYTVEFDVPLETISSLRLDTLSDASSPRGGPGRVGHGNCALANVPVSAAPRPAAGQQATQSQPVPLASARADFSQSSPNLPVSNAIDGDASTAWAIDPKVGASHVAVFDFEKPLVQPGGVRLTVMLAFQHNTRHSIGRPRLSVAAVAGIAAEPVVDGRDPVDSSRAERDRARHILAKPVAERTPEERDQLVVFQRLVDENWLALDADVRSLESSPPKPDLVKVLVASENVPRIPHHADGRGYPHVYPETHFLRRGDVGQKDGVASPGSLQVLLRHPEGFALWQQPAPLGATTSHRRAALARWITDVDYGAGPLAARVIVNRLWQYHFGEGLVSTPSDFGRQGAAPSHPELLEWLAGELVRGGWRLKPLHRLIVSSAAYRQSSWIDQSKAAVDPGNRLVWRFNRRRLEGEAIRDTFLSLAGTLDSTLYGRAGRDEASRRRSLYLERKRSSLPLFLRTFDSPDFVSGLARRSATTTAPQVLAIMNGPVVRTWAEAFAARLLAAGPVGHDCLVDRAYREAVGRPATVTERHDGTLFLEHQGHAYTRAGRSDAAARACADFCQVLMGLNETISIE
ncbi:MAG: DUF1549 domain-containing protein [Planctomycetaceae bacterium]